MRVLVTGATSMVGQRLVLRLIDQGDTVTVLSRQPLRALPLRKLGAHIVGGDITQPRTLIHALNDIEVVYHIAAQVGAGIIPAAYMLANVTGVANMLEVAKKAGITRFVHVSSAAAYAHAGPDTTEEREIGPGGRHNAYAVSKARGDLLVQAAGKRGDFATAIVRPVAIYDSGKGLSNATNWSHLLNQLPILPLPAGGEFPCGMVHADDVAQLLALCGTHDAAAGHAYNADDGDGLTFRAVLDKARPSGKRAPLIIALPASQRTRQGATFPATRAITELGFAPKHHWGEVTAAVAQAAAKTA